MSEAIKQIRRRRRHARIRTKVKGTAARPRMSVFKSNRELYAQVIDDGRGLTLAAISSRGLEGPMRERAAAAGKLLAKGAAAKNVTRVVFDRGGYRYGGAIKTFADAAREGGLIF